MAVLRAVALRGRDHAGRPIPKIAKLSELDTSVFVDAGYPDI